MTQTLPSSPDPQAEPRPEARAWLEERLRAALDHAGLPDEAPVGLAVSGGRDSMVLLALAGSLARSGRARPSVVHVDHGLRGAESDEDARFVAEEAARRGLPFHLERVRIPMGRGGLEARARAHRLAAFRRVALREGLRAILTAHHQDDQIETLLLRIARQAGLFGLAGIPGAGRPAAQLLVLRPFLEVPRATLAEVAAGLGLRHREDSSNRDLRHRRNRLRLRGLPALLEQDPGLPMRLLALAAEARRLQAEARALLEGRIAPAGVHELAGLRWVRLLPGAEALPVPIVLALLHRILGRPPRRSELLAASELLRRTRGTVNLAQGGRLRIEEGLLLAELGPAPPPKPLRLGLGPQAGILQVPAPRSGESPAPGSLETWLDPAGFRKEPVLRTPRPGERCTLGPGGRSQAVREALRARGVPAVLRPRWPIVADAAGVLWLPGVGTAERARGRGARGMHLGLDAPLAGLLAPRAQCEATR
jgi:tRNA(Ile)-lysidine synthase